MAHVRVLGACRRGVLALLLAVGLASTAQAQDASAAIPDSRVLPVIKPTPRIQASLVWARAAAPAPVLLSVDSNSIPPTNWAKGAVIGGAALGLFTGFLAAGFCGYDETGKNCTTATIGGFLVGAAVGAGLGAFIGARFPKHPKPAEAATN